MRQTPPVLCNLLHDECAAERSLCSVSGDMYWILPRRADVEGELKTIRTVCPLKPSGSGMPGGSVLTAEL